MDIGKYTPFLSVKVPLSDCKNVANQLCKHPSTEELGVSIREAVKELLEGEFTILEFENGEINTKFFQEPLSYENTFKVLVQLSDGNYNNNVTYQIVRYQEDD